MHYCFRCRKQQQKLNAMRMCAPCMTLWLSATPDERRKLVHVVKAS